MDNDLFDNIFSYMNHNASETDNLSSPFQDAAVVNSIFRNTLESATTTTATILVALLYSTISAVSIVGNGCFCFVTLRCETLHSATNFFMLHLSLANMLFVVASTPSFFTRYLFSYTWKLGLAVCKVSSSMVYITVTASFHLMMVVAIDRQRSLQAVGRNFTRCSVHFAALGIWTIAIIVALPYLYFYTVGKEDFAATSLRNLAVEDHLRGTPADETLRCKLQFPKHSASAWHSYLSLAVIVVQFIIPLTVMVPCYCHMIWVLWHQKSPLKGAVLQRSNSSNSKNRNIKRKKKSIIMLLLILLIFVVCWTPFFVIVLLTEFDITALPSGQIYITWMVCYILGMLSVCVSPWVYLLSDTFRNEPSTASKDNQRSPRRQQILIIMILAVQKRTRRKLQFDVLSLEER